MSIQLDENNVNLEGKDVNVINQSISPKVGFGSKLFEIFLWVLFIIPGIIFTFKKIKADNYFQQLQQKIQKNASQIDNYMEQRVVVLKNCAKILDKQADFEKGVFENIAKYRSGNSNDDQKRNEVATQIEDLSKSINIAFAGTFYCIVCSFKLAVRRKSVKCQIDLDISRMTVFNRLFQLVIPEIRGIAAGVESLAAEINRICAASHRGNKSIKTACRC